MSNRVLKTVFKASLLHLVNSVKHCLIDFVRHGTNSFQTDHSSMQLLSDQVDGLALDVGQITG